LFRPDICRLQVANFVGVGDSKIPCLSLVRRQIRA